MPDVSLALAEHGLHTKESGRVYNCDWHALPQIPDRTHRAAELEGIPYNTFTELVNDVLNHGNASVMLPSNLVLMYQAAMCATLSS